MLKDHIREYDRVSPERSYYLPAKKYDTAVLLPAALVLAALSHAAAIDLHVHVLMDAALPVFSGHPTDAPATVKDRKARLANQVSLTDLESADARLVVAALYPPVVLSQACGGYHKALLKRIDALKAWAGAYLDLLAARK